MMTLLILTTLGPGNELIAIAGCVGSGAAGMNLLAVGGEKRNGTSLKKPSVKHICRFAGSDEPGALAVPPSCGHNGYC